MMFVQSVKFAVEVWQPLLQHFFQLVEQDHVLLGVESTLAAQCPQAAIDRLQTQRVVVRTHLRALQQGHVTQLHTPETDLFVALETGGDFVDTDFQFEFFVADQRNARSRQTAGPLEAALYVERNQFIMCRTDFTLKGVERRRLRDATKLRDFR